MNSVHTRKCLPNLALHRLTRRVPVAKEEEIAGDFIKKIKDEAHQYDSVQYVYIVDEEERLTGVLSLKELFRLSSATPLGRGGRKKTLYHVEADAHQEKAVLIALRHQIVEVPVVKHDGRFLGAITNNTILSVLHRESREDLLRLAGIHPAHGTIDNIFEIPFLLAVRHRLPWLVIGLLGGLFTARFIGVFEKTLSQNLVLASFIPLVVYMSDAVGTQMEAFVIRDFALVRHLDFRKYFIRQFLIVLAIALILGGFVSLIAFFLYPEKHLVAILGISLVAAVVSSVLTGLVVPYLFRRLKLDPANASGPIATIMQDFFSVLIYFGTASLLL